MRCDQAVIVCAILYEHRYNQKLFKPTNVQYFREYPFFEDSNDLSANIRLLGLAERQLRKVVSIRTEDDDFELLPGDFVAIGGICHVFIVTSVQPISIMELWGQKRLLVTANINVMHHLHEIPLTKLLSFFLSNDLLVCNAFSKSVSKLSNLYKTNNYHLNQINNIYSDLENSGILFALGEGEESTTVHFNAKRIARDIINKGYLIIEYL